MFFFFRCTRIWLIAAGVMPDRRDATPRVSGCRVRSFCFTSLDRPPEQQPDGDFPQGYAGKRWVLPAAQTELRAAFDGFCSRWQYEPNVLAEADDMAMLRLLARDSGALTVLPTVVVKDEIAQGTLQAFMTLPNVYENFYAVTVKRQFVPPVLTRLLTQQAANTRA